jgi:DNA-binding NarL/FixJ family response regulator
VSRIKVLIAADHREFRKIVHDFLDRLPNVSVVGEAADGNDAVKKAEKLFPDVVLMDISLPLINGIEATRIIKQLWPAIKVFIATSIDDPIYQREALDAKVDGFIQKESLKPLLESMFGVQRKHT